MFESLDKYIAFLPIIFLSLTFTLFATPLIMDIAKRIGAVAKPKHLRDESERGFSTHIHDGIIPKLGFVPVVLPILFLAPFFFHIDFQIAVIFLCLVILFIFGVLDDKYNLPGTVQFAVLSFCCFAVIFSGINISEANNPFTGSFLNFDRGRVVIQMFGEIVTYNLLSVVVSFFWMMIVINAINWNDGVDGVLNGNIAIASLIILLVSIREANLVTGVISALLLGSNLGLLRYNFYPAKIFNSYGGQISGFLIAVLSILVQVKLSIAAMIILIPLLDFAWVLLGRIRRVKPRSLKQLFSILNISDTTHLHHRLLALGYGKRRVAFLEYVATLFAGVIAMILSGLELTSVFFGSILIVLLIFIFLDRIIARKNKEKE